MYNMAPSIPFQRFIANIDYPGVPPSTYLINPRARLGTRKGSKHFGHNKHAARIQSYQSRTPTPQPALL